MNRQQRRDLNKKMRKYGVTREHVDKYIKTFERIASAKPLLEGTKVKLNLESIKSHPDYTSLDEEYRSWVEEHEGKVFTVKHHPRHKNDPTYVMLKRFFARPKWAFWTGDLIVIKERKSRETKVGKNEAV